MAQTPSNPNLAKNIAVRRVPCTEAVAYAYMAYVR